MCGRLPRVPRLAASDHAASRQTPDEEAAGRESGNHVPFPATSPESMTVYYDLTWARFLVLPVCSGITARATLGIASWSLVESCLKLPCFALHVVVRDYSERKEEECFG